VCFHPAEKYKVVNPSGECKRGYVKPEILFLDNKFKGKIKACRTLRTKSTSRFAKTGFQGQS
jgi:hypothetical protein